MNIARRLAAERIVSLLLAATVVGSGVMAERLAGGNAAAALLAKTGATVALLATLIALLGPISGAHFNPAVSLIQAVRHALSWRDAAAYTVIQVLGCCMGVILAHAMFDLPLVQSSLHARGSFSVARGGRGDVRVAPGHSGAPTARGGAVDGGGMDRGCVLVHRLDVLREPGHHDRTFAL